MGRKLIVVRHGERVDLTFGMDWFDHCFDEEGRYIKSNLNMPDTMIKRAGSPKSFVMDGPLTQVGELQGVLVGKGFTENKALRPGFEVYVSPSLRSIQTADAILKGMGLQDIPLRIEPTLFEWTAWVPNGLPEFATPEELKAHGYNIDESYKPLSKLDMEVNESVKQYYVRTHELVHQLVANSENDILLVAHGATLDCATRQLLGFPARHDIMDMRLRLNELPYACVGVAEKDETTGKWGLNEPGALTMRHSSNHYFNCKKQFTHGDK